jgi:uncharacterized protein (TIGR02246 family)
VKRQVVLPVAALCAALAVGFLAARERQPAAAKAPDAGRDADAEAIAKSARDFTAAFARGDAKAVAAMWSEEGESEDADGAVVRGREAIEKAFAETFKDKKQGKLDVEIRSIRYPSRDTAIEEGFLRHTPDGPGLPTSTLYTAAHVREDGKWLIATSREYGAGQDRLGDLAFLIGTWQGGPTGKEASVSFEKDPTGPFILGTFTRTADGKAVAKGTMKIGLDAQRGQLRSWHFDDGGGHGQSLWLRDGDHWVLDAIGATGDGTETAAVNILSRLGPDELTWRSIDRVVGDAAIPDTVPVKLTRVPTAK